MSVSSGIARQMLTLAAIGGVAGLILGWVLLPAGIVPLAIAGAMTLPAIRVATLLASDARTGRTDRDTQSDH